MKMRTLSPDALEEVLEQAKDAADGDDCGSAHMVLFDVAQQHEALVKAALYVGEKCPIRREFSGLAGTQNGLGADPQEHFRLVSSYLRNTQRSLASAEKAMSRNNCYDAYNHLSDAERLEAAAFAHSNDSLTQPVYGSGGDYDLGVIRGRFIKKCIIYKKASKKASQKD